MLLVAALLLAGFDQAYQHAGSSFGDGFLDEPAHLLTGFLFLAAVLRGAPLAFAGGLLAASVLIDLDHVPQYLGDYFLTHGTQRPYTHSWVTLAALLLLAVLIRRPRAVRPALLGAAIGIAVHFYRDMAEKTGVGVPLLWPFSDHEFTVPHDQYLAVMAVLLVVALARAAASRRAPPAARAAR